MPLYTKTIKVLLKVESPVHACDALGEFLRSLMVEPNCEIKDWEYVEPILFDKIDTSWTPTDGLEFYDYRRSSEDVKQ